MKFGAWATSALGCVLMAGAVGSQTVKTIDLGDTYAWQGRPFLLRLGSSMDVHQSGPWTGESRMRDYDKLHRGEQYLLFEEAGSLYRLDTPAALADLEHLHEPIEQLAELQQELAAVQAPLAEQQRALGAQMRATSNPVAMGRIGREQGSIGRRQGGIGREQGVIGRQQGVLGRAFYQNAQGLIDTCLRERSCTVVAPAAPAAARR